MMTMVLAYSMVSAADECINPGTTRQNGLGGENQSFGPFKELVRNLRNSNDSPRFVVVVSQLVGPVPRVPRAPAGRREVPLAAPAAGSHPSSGGLHEHLEVWCLSSIFLGGFGFSSSTRTWTHRLEIFYGYLNT